MSAARVMVLCLGLLAAPQTFADGDPLEPINRPIHALNEGVDRIVLKPAAKTYRRVRPGFVRAGIGNFFSNLGEVSNVVNNVLQAKPGDAFNDFGRLFINSNVGVGGVFDVASSLGLPEHQEDFGQTLATWRVGQGPYIVLPFLGPSTLRDAIARSIDTALNPVRHVDHVPTRNVLLAADLVVTRADILQAESVIFGEKYLFYRDAYLQRRNFLINDGEVTDTFDDDF
ncbi:MAG: hypothetical protein CMQ24_18120 [Gammaproteobacteria bacterium]|nr:hypothetical protein [Gammaproteobacteria bacterium]